ncbi:MAG: histidine kinase [Atopobiaceae bacterium]|nr:histidine kinase [Atopobiaceae bacterium]
MSVLGRNLGRMAWSFGLSDRLQSQETERTLRTASLTLQHMSNGLSPESCRAVCELLLPETKAMAVAMTDRSTILAYVGELEADFPAGSPIQTVATREVLASGEMKTFSSVVAGDPDGPGSVPSPEGLSGEGATRQLSLVPAGIVVPLCVRGKEPVGTIKFYYRNRRDIDRTQAAIASGLGELLSTQLSVYELDRQAELTTRAELKALQAQIDPHFLFNTLNTIASLTRTEPAEARGLLREFASFYRATLENSTSLIPLSRELEQTRRYLRFEHARFGEERIIWSEHIAKGCEDVIVPAFVVQPIVENSVRHAMRDEGNLHIDIHVLEEGDDILISVADDGLGMGEKTVSHLLDAPVPSDKGTGIALYNVTERIKRFYGPGSGVEVVSKPGEGTCVTLHLVDAVNEKK